MYKLSIKRNVLGFTMVELLVAVGIVMIMTAATLPVLNKLTTKSAVDQATQQFQSDVGLIQSKAISGAVVNGEVTYWGFSIPVCLVGGTNEIYRLGHAFDDNHDKVLDGFTTDKEVPLPKLTVFDNCSFNKQIYFERFTGKLVDKDGNYIDSVSITIKHTENPTRVKTVLITSGGKIESN